MPLSRPANAYVTRDSNQFQRRQRGPWPVTAEQFEMVQYIVVDYNCTYSISPVKVWFLGKLKTLQRQICNYNLMVGWQYSDCHGQCLSESTPRSRGHQCVNPVSFGKNDSQLHLPWYTSPVSDAPADRTSRIANCSVVIIQAVEISIW